MTMRITIASSGLGHVTRGVESWAADLARALYARGHQVTLCKGGGQASAPYERIIRCWQRGAAGTKRLLSWLPRRGVWRLGLGSAGDLEQHSFALRLLSHLRRERIDILHVQDAIVADFVRKARWLGLVRTTTILGLGSKETWEFQKRFTYLHYLAPAYLEEAGRAGVRKPTWTAIPLFVDTNAFRPGLAPHLRAQLGIPATGQVILTAAAIKREHKRTDYLLQEFALLRRTWPDLPIWLVVAGAREPDTDELVALGQRLLGDRVRFLIDFPRECMPDLYRMADFFVLCSLREMFGLVMLEAASSGLPCLVHDHPVLKWVVGPGGEAIDMSVPGSLATAMRHYVEDPSLRATLRERAREHCVARFSPDMVVNQTLDYYRLVYGHNRAACR